MRKFLLLPAILFYSTIVFSQNKTGIGNVSDVNGTLVPNAIIQLSPVTDSTTVYEYLCDKNGNYSFDIASNETFFKLNIYPSAQTLQFTFSEQSIYLADGNNEILFHKVQLSNSPGIRFTVVDSLGIPVAGAKVSLYDTERKWRVDSCAIMKPVLTDNNGQVEINSLLPSKYWFNVSNGYSTNRFTKKNTGNPIDTAVLTTITDTIRDLSQNEFFMTGLCDNKTWKTDSMVIFGVSQPYDADSKLLSDGTWYDSNGNHGYWWFNPGETTMTYDYDSNSTNGGGSKVDASLIELNDTSFSGNMTMFGMPVTYYMSAVYDTINLQLSVRDTTLYLDNNGTIAISPADLMLSSSYCFTCTTTLSQSSFGINDLGTVNVIATMQDRCGNSVTDTFIVNILDPVKVREVKKPNLYMYPNPSSGRVNIDNAGRYTMIQISDIKGIIFRNLNVSPGLNSIDISDFKSGIYFLELSSPDGSLLYNKLVVE